MWYNLPLGIVSIWSGLCICWIVYMYNKHTKEENK